MGTLSMLALLRGHSYRRCVVQGRSQLVPGWVEEENGGASCKVSFILPLLWSFFFLSLLRRSHEIMAHYTPVFSPEEEEAGVVITQMPVGGTTSLPHFLFLSSRGEG